MTGTHCTLCTLKVFASATEEADLMTSITRRFNANGAAIFPERTECFQL